MDDREAAAFAKNLGLDVSTLRSDSMLELPSAEGYFTPVRRSKTTKGNGSTFPAMSPGGSVGFGHGATHSGAPGTPGSTSSLAAPALPPISKSQRRGLVSTAHSPTLPRTHSAGAVGAGAGADVGPSRRGGSKLRSRAPATAWAELAQPTGTESPFSRKVRAAADGSDAASSHRDLSVPPPELDAPESDSDDEDNDGYILTPELRLKVLQGEVVPVRIEPEHTAGPAAGGRPRMADLGSFSSSAPAAMAPAMAPTLVHHTHNEPLSLTMREAETDDGQVDLDRLYLASDTSMRVNVKPKVFRSEYKFVESEEFDTQREPTSRLAMTRAAKAQADAEARAKEARFTKTRPMLADIQHQFPLTGASYKGTAKTPVDTEVHRRFADRPILKSVHFRFPGGVPAAGPGANPRMPTHMEMREYVEDRRTWEEVEGDTMPSWAPHVGDGDDLDEDDYAATVPFHRVSKMGAYGRAIGAAPGDGVPPVDGMPTSPERTPGSHAFSPMRSRGSPGNKGGRRRKGGRGGRRRRKGRRGGGSTARSGGSRSGFAPTSPWFAQLELEKEELEELAATHIQRLFRGWRIRLEMMELMQPAVVVQHPFRSFINFRVWRYAVMTVAANRIIRTQRRRWLERAARKARALQWARDIKAANDIQRCYRGYLGRLIAKDLRMKRANRVATIMQSAARQWFATKRAVKRLLRRLRRGEIRTRASIYIQTAYRRYRVQTMISWWHYAAGVIQVHWRAYVAKRHWYALQIQRVWRAHYSWVWVKQWCASKITRVGRGFLARLAVKKEKLRLQNEEDERWAMENHVTDVAGDVGRKEMEKYLESGRGVEEIQAGAVLLQNKSRMLATQRKEESWQAQLRDTFTLFDVDQRGSLDEVQLGDLLREMCVPFDPNELHAAVLEMDKDGNGFIELDEFTQFFASLDIMGVESEVTSDGTDLKGDGGAPDDDEGTNAHQSRRAMQRKMRLLKWQMKTQSFVNEIWLTVYKKLAARAMVAKAGDDARKAARANFRRKFPPRYFCTKCTRTFIFDSQLRLHWYEDCDPRDIHT